ncbi:MAG: hypothetical protein LIP09_16660 [Bacteroidales bacterium]|nr:hypothetical protein [Bacteroidales bacterium]
MTAAFTNSNFFAPAVNEPCVYQVEVITYDGDSEIVDVEANNAEQAQAMAASLVDNADYTMIVGVYA